MEDRQIVAGVLLGDRAAVAALYDGYADVLHDYARRRAPTEADAADVVHDAFLVAVERIGQLRDPERLRPWLYAIARTELHRRYRHSARFVALDPGGEQHPGRAELVSQEPGPDVQVERAELVSLVREATAGLADGDRELLDLHLRHGLVGADLAAAAGLPARHASVALERVKGRLARTLGVVLLSRHPTCAEFTAIRDGQPGLTPLARKRLARHVDNCSECSQERARRMRPEVLLAAVPMLPAPPELRHRLVATQQRLAEGAPAQPLSSSWPYWDGDGFPVAAPARRRRLGLAAALLALLALGGAALVVHPLITERSVAGTPGLARPSTPVALPGAARTPVAPTTAPATTAPASAPPETTAAATTAPPSTRTTTRTTTGTRPPTTTAPRDTAPPVIGLPSMDPPAFSTTYKGTATCFQQPIGATVTATVTDPSGVAAVVLTWSGPAGSGGTVTMKPTPGGGYLASVGPVPTDGIGLPFDSYPLKASVTATDTAGNQAQPRVTTFLRAVNHCGIG